MVGLLSKIGIKKKQEEVKPPEQPAAAAPPPPAQATKGAVKHGALLLMRPVLSEKGTALAGKGKYVFAVAPRANKPEIKKSVQNIYDVHVTKVRIIKMPGKARRYGRSTGMTAAWKKAIVTLKPGEKIAGIIESVG